MDIETDAIPVPLPQGQPVDGAAFAELANGPVVVDELRRFYRQGDGPFADPAPPRVPTWGGAQVRMVAALTPLMEENARLRAALAERDGAAS